MMVLISHRGNVNGKFESYENEPNYIDMAISKGYDVEVDIWYDNNILYLGHDRPQYGIQYHWFIERINKLWIHCKNIPALEFLDKSENDFNYFWHNTDTATLTSHKIIWAYPGTQPIKNSIAVMPELHNDDVSLCYGICSDLIYKYK